MVDERWLPVAEPDFEDLYEVSDRGRVRSVPRQTSRGLLGGNILTPGRHPKGYMNVVLSGNGKRRCVLIHRLVLGAFDRPREDGEECKHGNGDPADNRWPENISWGTNEENHQDRIRHGHSGKGEQNTHAKLTAEDVAEIKRRYANGDRQKAIAAAYGIRQPQVSRLVTGKRWAHLDQTGQTG